jgi:hypothetical protein
MSNFKEFVTRLLNISPDKPFLVIEGVTKKIIGMSRYATKNMPDGEYIKIVFEDHSLLLIIISDQEIYYADKPLGRIEYISDDMVTTTVKLQFLGKEYEVVNQNDYQYVLQKYIGGVNDIEGECSFSDFAPVDGSKAMLSLGIISATGQRADVYCELIALSDITVTSQI